MLSLLRSASRSKWASRPSCVEPDDVLGASARSGRTAPPARSLITIASRLSKLTSLTSTPYFSQKPFFSAGSMYWAQL